MWRFVVCWFPVPHNSRTLTSLLFPNGGSWLLDSNDKCSGLLRGREREHIDFQVRIFEMYYYYNTLTNNKATSILSIAVDADLLKFTFFVCFRLLPLSRRRRRHHHLFGFLFMCSSRAPSTFVRLYIWLAGWLAGRQVVVLLYRPTKNTILCESEGLIAKRSSLHFLYLKIGTKILLHQGNSNRLLSAKL